MYKSISNLALLIALVLIASACASEKSDSSGQASSTNNETELREAPNFEVTTIEGNTVSLQQSLENNNPMVIYFTASWCPICAKNWPVLSEVYPDYRGSGIGAVRTLTLQDGGKVKEKLESLDADNKVLKYSIVESPMPIQNYTGTMEVQRINDGQSEFTWSSNFEAAEGTEDDMKEALEGLYSLGVEGLKSTF